MVETEMLWRLASEAEDVGDFGRMLELARRGSALGDPVCWFQLGLAYDLGRGVDIDKQQAMRCYRTAWRNHYMGAANNIAILYRERGDNRAMFRWFERATAQGDDGAFLEMAKCYRKGVGVRASAEQAVRCLAAALGGTCISEAEREEAQALLAEYRMCVIPRSP
ncbi:tetratricopeptide repeat protein [Caulobacter sp. S45]|uniref:tetratricopeptide repeat protein n=1 Tax=Caulobacter sp. S45 TaxID=1641861 RepID=UPI00131E440A|nr:SEL1-like repeat protein [Caulobacter sp. S45]